jgi:hypothetical protein
MLNLLTAIFVESLAALTMEAPSPALSLILLVPLVLLVLIPNYTLLRASTCWLGHWEGAIQEKKQKLEKKKAVVSFIQGMFKK